MQTYSQLDNFHIIKTLGTGYSGKVKLGRDIQTGQTFALKILSGTPEKIQKILATLSNEFEIVKKLDHPSIVKFVDLRTNGLYISRKTGAQKTKIYAIIELATKGELFDVIFHAGAFDENLAKYYFKQFLYAVEYLHANNIAHRDLKPENLLLDDNLMLKLVDFGFATFVEPGKKNKTRLGTERYMAPELMYKLPYDAKKADVFAMGVILFVFFSGHPPFHEATEHDPYYKLFIKNPKGFWEFHAKQNLKRNYSESFKNLISKMIELKASARFSIEDIKKSEWFNEIVDEQLAAQNMHAYMQKMAAVIQATKAQTNTQNQTFRSGNSHDKLNFLAPLTENLKNVTIESLPETSSGKRCDLVVKLAEKDDLLRLVVNMAKHNGAEIISDQSSHLRLRFPAQGLNQTAVIELNLYSLGSESLYGIDVLNHDSDYFDFMAHKSKFVQELHAHCPKA